MLTLTISSTAAELSELSTHRPCGRSDKGLLYKVTGNGLSKPSFLFGSHHLFPVSFVNDVEGFDEALASVDVVVGEMIIGEAYGAPAVPESDRAMPDGYAYETLLSEEDCALLYDAMRNILGPGSQYYRRMHPAIVKTALTIALHERTMPDVDFSDHVSIDEYVQIKGAEMGKEILGLETADEQLGFLLDSTPIDEAVEALMDIVRNPGYYEEKSRELTDCYTSGDLGRLYELYSDSDDEHSLFTEAENYTLNISRNDAWLEKLPDIMRARPAFIAVGAIHLVGDEGLIARLREAGYTVEAVGNVPEG